MKYEISAEIAEFVVEFSAKHPDDKLDKMDWLRCSYAQKLFIGTSLIDIGPGVGMMLHVARRTFSKLSAVDIKLNTKALFPPGVTFYETSIATPELNIPSHDTVVCMEVLEHLPSSENAPTLRNLRQLTKKRLIVTTPFAEREPLWGHDQPGGHRQRFTIDKLADLFPTAYGTILPRYGIEWVLLVEDPEFKAAQFSLVGRRNLLNTLGIEA